MKRKSLIFALIAFLALMVAVYFFRRETIEEQFINEEPEEDEPEEIIEEPEPEAEPELKVTSRRKRKNEPEVIEPINAAENGNQEPGQTEN